MAFVGLDHGVLHLGGFAKYAAVDSMGESNI
jgi:hypothetical protein